MTLPLGVSVRLDGFGIISVDLEVAGMLWLILL